MRLIDRYVIRETVVPFLLALAVLTFMLDVQPMLKDLQSFLAKGVAGGTILHLVVLLLPQALGLTIPMSFLIALLMAFGRLSADREAVALLACGVSLQRLLRPVLVMAVVTGLATLYVMVDLIPYCNDRYLDLEHAVLTAKTSQDIRPRLFFQEFPGKVLYVQSVEPDGTWRDVLLADTSSPGRPVLQLAEKGWFAVDAQARRVTIFTDQGRSYSPGSVAGTYDAGVTGRSSFSVDPNSVFTNSMVWGGVNQRTIAELRAEIAENLRNGISIHNETMAIQMKFSFPVACLVMALLGLALGVHTRREGKFAGFALGLAVIFVYYGLLEIFEALTKGGSFPAVWARWVPNIVLGAVGMVLLWRRARSVERDLALSPRWTAWARRLSARAERRGGLRVPGVRLLDLYVGSRYLRVGALSFVGLLGLFYISSFFDLSDKLFKGKATTGLLFAYFGWSTPQFVYYVVPIATLVSVLVTIGALTKTSELTVMRACGISLYRIAAPLVALSIVWSVGLVALDNGLMARANEHAADIVDVIKERPPHTIALSDRHWLAGRDGRVYYYKFYDPARQRLEDVSIFDVRQSPFELVSHTYAENAVYRGGSTWMLGPGWVETFDESRDRPARVDRPAPQLAALEPAASFVSDPEDAETMTYRQLGQEVDRLRASGFAYQDDAVKLQSKFALPASAFVLTLLALPFAVTTGRRGALYGVGLAIALTLGYRGAVVVCSAMGAAGVLAPWLAAWAPNFLFLAGATAGLLLTRT